MWSPVLHHVFLWLSLYKEQITEVKSQQNAAAHILIIASSVILRPMRGGRAWIILEITLEEMI